MGGGVLSCVQLRFLNYQPRILFQIHFVFRATELSQVNNGQRVLWLLGSLVWTFDYKVGRGIELKGFSKKKRELFVDGICVGLLLRGQCHNHEEGERLSELTLL